MMQDDLHHCELVEVGVEQRWDDHRRLPGVLDVRRPGRGWSGAILPERFMQAEPPA
jgi:hypothetical protein